MALSVEENGKISIKANKIEINGTEEVIIKGSVVKLN
jgi:hypothetical protein